MSENSKQQYVDQIENFLDNQQREELANLFEQMRESEIAEIVEILDDNERRIVFDILDKETSAEVLERVNEATRSKLFDILNSEELTEIITELDPEDAADIISEMEEDEGKELLSGLAPNDLAQIQKILEYDEDSAGGIMDLDVIRVSESATVSQAINLIRSAHIDEDFYSVFVVDSNGKFLGDVRIRHLITAPENTEIRDLLETDTIQVKIDTDQEEVRNLFNKNNLIVMPVLDDQNRLVGRITADRVIEVAQEEAVEDIYTMAGTEPEELEDSSIFRAARIRMTWLLPCLFGTAVTAVVVLVFKGIFKNGDHDIFYIYTTAIAFMPMIAAISGNAGLQTSAIVVSGLAGGHLVDMDLAKVFAREVRVAFLVAICCGIIGGTICSILPNFINLSTSTAAGNDLLRISAAFTIAMFTSIMVSTTLGFLLPFLFRKIGIDPAISSGPLVTTANDSISVAIYLALTLSLA